MIKLPLLFSISFKFNFHLLTKFLIKSWIFFGIVAKKKTNQKTKKVKQQQQQNK